ncbi:MAG: hypothetical protein QOI54_3152 [Actinomycetota bacterium]|jgi:acetyltransferase-like isoleucine patch superfamily enzyme|nr:hypothetical protein [Actinomycetota bacterium]
MTPRVHPTAIVEDDVILGAGTSVWDNAHLRSGAVVGRECIVGGKSYLAGETKLGDRVKINAFVYICSGVTVEDGVMVSAHVTFTNDRFPRATTPDLATLRSSAVDEHTELTLVREGATLGAAAVIGPGLVVGRFAMVGMGGVVTGDVPDFHLVVGSPAASVGAVCRCGAPVVRWRRHDGPPPGSQQVTCGSCGRGYTIADGTVVEASAVVEGSA